MAGLAASFGSGAMTNSMDDVAEQAKAIFIIGSNTTEQHPVFGTRIRQAVLRRGLKLVVADPRKIDITEFATLHLQLNPGSDIALLNGLMYIILEKGYEDKTFIADRTEGFEEFKTNVMQYSPDIVSETTGIPVEKLYEAAEILGTTKPGAVLWAMGITQHVVGVQNVRTCANLQMLLGNIGIPGAGVNPLRGQNNVQGACDMGGLPNVYPAYQPVINDEVRQKFETAWGTPLSPKVGLTLTEMMPLAGEDKIKALYILGENPIMTDPDSNHIRHCMEELDFLVLQEIFPSETAVYADVLLPGVTFAEKRGTFTNTERRVQLVRKAIDPLGDAKPDWWITTEIAKRVMRYSDRKVDLSAPKAGWEFDGPESIMSEISSLAPSYAGVNFDRLENGDRLQWPVKTNDHAGTPILHVGQFTRGKGLFAVTQNIPPVEMPDKEYPMLLSTGRVLYHWHGGEMSRRSKGLMEVYGESLVELNPQDAQKLGLKENGKVSITSRRGAIEAGVWITERVPAGMVYANFHFPEVPANDLTLAALDPIAKIPEYKVCAVKIALVG